MKGDAAEAPLPVLFGRKNELATLLAALERARDGRGRLVAVVGEAGIGKTRLVEELVRRSHLSDGSALWGRCVEQRGAPSYWPWIRLVRALAATRGIDQLKEALGGDVSIVARLLPGLVAAEASPATARPAVDDPEARFLLFEALTSLFRKLAAAEPLIIVLEDLHWADDASLVLLEFVAQELEGTRLLLIVTYRDPKRVRLPRPLVEALRRGQRISLEGLDRDAIDAIVTQAAGTPATPALVDRLADVTAGNPFFLGEVLRTLEEEGRLDPSLSPSAPLTLPDSVRDSILLHIDPLSEGDRDVLAHAAVMGQEFDVAALALATDMDATAILERLRAAVEGGLVVERVAGRFRFAHALVRETIYGDLPPAARVHRHARIGDALERLYGEDDDAPSGMLAHHFLHAAPLGTGPKAVAWGTRAGQQAMAVYAYQDALAAYEQALDALGGDAVDRPRRLALLLAAGEAARRAGADPRARELFLLSARDARALADHEGLFRAAVGYYQVSPGIAALDPETVPLLEEAIRATDADDSPTRARLLALLSAARAPADPSAEVEAMSQTALEMARRMEDPRALTTVLLTRQMVLVGAGSTEERLALANEALALTQTSIPEAEFRARSARTQCFLELGDVASANAEIDHMARSADRLRQPDRQWAAGVHRAAIALLEGRFDDGTRIAAEALAMRRNASDMLALQVFVLQMFLARRDTGHHGGLEGSLHWMVEHHGDIHPWRCVLAVFLADLGRLEEARALFEDLAAGDFAEIRRYQNRAAALAWLARVCVFTRDATRAHQLYPLLSPYAGRNIVVAPNSQACLGAADRYLGLLAETMGRDDQAEEHYQGALTLNETMRARPVVACVQHEYARLLQRRNRPGDRSRAQTLLDQARATAKACGMSQLLGWMKWLGPIELEEAPAKPVISAPAGLKAPAARDSGAPAHTETTVAVLRRDGDVWLVGFAGETFRMKDARGVHLLATLLQHAGQEIHALDLAAGGPGAGDAGDVSDRGDAGPLLDPAARTAYKSRLEDLRYELEEAERFADPARAARARHEMEFLADELARGVGLGGRDRRAASAAERARVNATRTIGTAIKKIAASLPRLGEHLRATVRTGYLCVYAPHPTSPIRWEL